MHVIPMLTPSTKNRNQCIVLRTNYFSHLAEDDNKKIVMSNCTPGEKTMDNVGTICTQKHKNQAFMGTQLRELHTRFGIETSCSKNADIQAT